MVPTARRLLPSALVALAVAFVGFGVVGVASANQDEPGLYGSVFQVAPRHGGDAGVIAWSEESRFLDGRVDTAVNGSYAYRWGLEEAWPDPTDGEWHAAHGRTVRILTLDVQLGDYQEQKVFDHSVWVDSRTGEQLGVRTDVRYESSQSVSSLHSQAVTNGTSAMLAWSRAEACGLDAAVHAGLVLQPTVLVRDLCLSPDGLPIVFTVAASEVDGEPTVAFSTTLARSETASLHVTIQYSPDLPEPLLVEHRQEDVLLSHVHLRTERLAGFSQGEQPWQAGTVLPPTRATQAPELAQRMPWGPDDSGVEHPFPASAAWAAAQADRTLLTFHDFLEAHPQARTLQLVYGETEHDNHMERHWEFTVGEGGLDAPVYDLLVRQTIGPVAAEWTDPFGLPSTALAGSDQVTTSASGAERLATFACEPPAQLPTVASIAATWTTLTRSALPLNAWGLECGDVSAGHSSALLERSPGVGAVAKQETFYTLQQNLLTANATGPVRLEWTTEGRQTEGLTTSNQPPPPRSSAEPQSVEGFQFEVASVGWHAPSKPVASGAALVSVVAGALYWLWPTLKGGAAGLFSRIETPQLLRHPVRRAIVDAVEAQPGIHFQAIARLVEGGQGAIEHHLRKLVAAGLLVRHQGPGYTCYFPPSTDRHVLAAAGVLKSMGARRVLSAAQARPGATAVDLAAATGLDASTVSHHVHRLAGAGLLTTARVGRTLVVQPTGLAERVASSAA